jgi:hypothetical protein
MTTPIEIPLSKRKLVLMLIAAAAFVASGIWFLLYTSSMLSAVSVSPSFIKLVGIVAIVFFGICCVFIARKLFDNRPGFIITETGLIDNSSGISAGEIPWKDIRGITNTTIANKRFIMILLHNPEEYINRQTSILKRKAMEMNYKHYGSPVSISTSGLRCSFGELKQLLDGKFKEYGAVRLS